MDGLPREDPATEILLALLEAAAADAVSAGRDRDAAAVMVSAAVEDATDAMVRLRKLSKRWVRDGVRVFQASQELERHRVRLAAAQRLRDSAQERHARRAGPARGDEQAAREDVTAAGLPREHRRQRSHRLNVVRIVGRSSGRARQTIDDKDKQSQQAPGR